MLLTKFAIEITFGDKFKKISLKRYVKISLKRRLIFEKSGIRKMDLVESLQLLKYKVFIIKHQVFRILLLKCAANRIKFGNLLDIRFRAPEFDSESLLKCSLG